MNFFHHIQKDVVYRKLILERPTSSAFSRTRVSRPRQYKDKGVQMNKEDAAIKEIKEKLVDSLAVSILEEKVKGGDSVKETVKDEEVVFE